MAAASVIAKVHRDGGMRVSHEDFPVYGWTRTRATRAAATSRPSREHGPSALHRHTWLHERPEDALTLFDLGVG